MVDYNAGRHGISTDGTLVRAQLALNEPASEVERTLDKFAAAIKLTGMRIFDRDLDELRTLLSERAR